eukprot:TRINITY_DN3212_c0_g1_i10.p1 TRINITY_DN3212_c0_g1~~TRINITY_DN3212_c0_g1_i10.p1  ORF type:complete len:227 (+),score=-20.60 TRINITY_DN3212_c0_g1_i10:1228-1908(+)
MYLYARVKSQLLACIYPPPQSQCNKIERNTFPLYNKYTMNIACMNAHTPLTSPCINAGKWQHKKLVYSMHTSYQYTNHLRRYHPCPYFVDHIIVHFKYIHTREEKLVVTVVVPIDSLLIYIQLFYLFLCLLIALDAQEKAQYCKYLSRKVLCVLQMMTYLPCTQSYESLTTYNDDNKTTYLILTQVNSIYFHIEFKRVLLQLYHAIHIPYISWIEIINHVYCELNI